MNTYYTTIKEMQAEYRKQIREFERLWNSERSLVRSVPERTIAVCSVEIGQAERWEPG